MSSISSFVIQKALIGIGGEPKSVKSLRSGDLLIETLSAIQTKSFLQVKTFLNSPVNIYPHKTLNSCRGIISESDLLTTTDAEILDGFSFQGVIQCQRFGHSKTSCRDRLTCSRCASLGHASTDCRLEPKCINCLQPHPSDSKLCPKWKIEKQIQEIKTTKNISYPEARKLTVPLLSQTYAQAAKSSTLNNSTQKDENITKIKCPPLKLLASLSSKQRPNIPTAVTTSSSAQAQLLPSISSKTSTISNPQPPTPMSETKGKLKNNHLQERDSANGSTPVSKKSRRRITFKTLEAMDTGADPSDSDYVIGFSRENSLHEPNHSLQCLLPTKCCYPRTRLEHLVEQLPAPFVILGDFHGHSTLWGSVKTNPRGSQIEQVLSDHEEPTYFHEPTRSFHTLDLALCSPSLLPHLNLSVEKDLYNIDHFPVILSHGHDTGGKTFPPTYSCSRADWALFTQLAVIFDAMVKTESVDTAVQEVTNVLIAAADLSIPKSSCHSFQHYKSWWNTDCNTAYKNQRKLWGIFLDIPLRRISWRSKRQKQMLAEVWEEHCFPFSWREAIVIPILKPGKVATDPLSYHPIALTSYFCKTFERMVNTRLVYVLDKEKLISLL
ncbi:RNA-directed DNA polymerase from mobile element jockey [Trichonephila clavipes]|nr:RNA-directed DNA polymerase from mobile element jockey [Trichonephila clavipes]